MMGIREYNLTNDGVLKLITRSEDDVTVQLLDIRRIPRSHLYLHDVTISDGFKSVRGYLNYLVFIRFIRPGRLIGGSTVVIKDYDVYSDGDRHHIYVSDVEVKDISPGFIIGNPVEYTGWLIVDESDDETVDYSTILSYEDNPNSGREL